MPADPPRRSAPTSSKSRLAAPLLLSILILLPWGIAGCEAEPPPGAAAGELGTFSGTPPVRICVTVGMLGDLARTIAGDRGEVSTLMGPGTDPHLYKPSPGDVRQLLESDLILYVGHHLEGRMTDVFRRVRDRNPAVAVCERIPTERLLTTEEGVIDPHLWFDVALWADVAEEVRDVLTAFDPEGADGYRSRCASLVETLRALDGEVRDLVGAIPEARRAIVTAHDAFGYFGAAYGFDVIGVQGLSTESEAAVSHINELVGRIVERGLPAVFVESTISHRNIEALIEGCAARDHALTIGGELYSDAMGAADTPAGTYIGMVRHNVGTIVEALR